MRFATLAVSLLLLLSSAVLASSRGYGVQLGLRGLRTHAPAMCDVAFKALLKSMHEPAHYEQDYDTPPDCEIKAFHTEDTEEATGLDEAPSGLTISLTPLLPRTASEPACAAASWVPDLLESSTLPRGPPLG